MILTGRRKGPEDDNRRRHRHNHQQHHKFSRGGTVHMGLGVAYSETLALHGHQYGHGHLHLEMLNTRIAESRLNKNEFDLRKLSAEGSCQWLEGHISEILSLLHEYPSVILVTGQDNLLNKAIENHLVGSYAPQNALSISRYNNGAAIEIRKDYDHAIVCVDESSGAVDRRPGDAGLYKSSLIFLIFLISTALAVCVIVSILMYILFA